MPRNVQRLLLISSLYLAVGAASAQSWPTKTVTIVVPFPAGGTTDVLARAVGTKLSAVIGQSVIVDNKPGAGATLGYPSHGGYQRLQEPAVQL
jgi:tripartite-type tricarboxylate transporter receptor subunit TctC